MPPDPQAKIVIDAVQTLGIATLTEGADPNVIRGLMNAAVLPSAIELDRLEDTTILGPVLVSVDDRLGAEHRFPAAVRSVVG